MKLLPIKRTKEEPPPAETEEARQARREATDRLIAASRGLCGAGRPGAAEREEAHQISLDGGRTWQPSRQKIRLGGWR